MSEDAVNKCEARLRTLTRMLQALRNSGKALIRSEEESSYLKEVCRIVIEDCGHAMVWIGIAENDAEKSVRPVAAAGFEEGYLETLKLTWADADRGHGPTGTAIRTGKVVLCRNILKDASYAPWREEATRRGYASSIAVPLTSNGATIGALSLYSSEPDPFSEDEITLLTDLAEDVAFGICSLRLRKANAAAEQTLRQSEKQFRMLFENACDGIFITDAQGCYVDANTRGLEMLGMERHELLGRCISDIVTQKEQSRLPAALEEVRCGRPHIEEWEFKRKNGAVFCGEINGQLLPDGRMIGILRDLTERNRSQRERDLMIEFLRLVNTGKSVRELLHKAALFFKEHAGCDAVGIRLREGDDFPYCETLGFSNDFLQAENRLCEYDETIRTLRAACLCGKVISGQLAPLQAFFTETGTFWTNDSSALLEGPFDVRERVRGRCIHAGYGSIALLPLQDGLERMGLLQLNAWRKGAFMPESLSVLERLADHLAVSVSKLKAEEALRESEARFRNIFDHAATGIAISMCAGRLVQCNAAFCNLTGYSREELMEMEFSTLIAPDDYEGNMVLMRQLLDGEIPSFEIENRYIHKSGGFVWVHKYVSLLYDDRGHPTHIVALVTDMTERKQNEEVLRFLGQCSAGGSNEDFFPQLARYLAQALNMDFVCIDRLENDRLTAQTLAVFNNGNFEDNIAYTLKDTPCGDVVGKQICCFPKNVRRQFPKDAVLQKLNAESYLGTTLWGSQGEPIGLIAAIGHGPLKNTRQAEAILQVSAVRAAGELERQQIEAVRRASEEQYRLLFQNVQEGFYLAEPLYKGDTCCDAVYLDVNPAFERIMGLSRDQIIGHRATELVPLINPEWFEMFGKVVRTGEPVSHQAYSKMFQKYFEAFLFRPQPGKFAVLVSDITERKQFEQALKRMNAELERRVSARTEELAKTNRELEAFCYSVSHDLRAPLRSMDGFSQALLEDYGTRLDAEGQDFLHRIRSNSQRMARLIDDLLQLSRLTRSQMQLRQVDLSALAQAAIDDLRQSDPSRGVDVRIAPGLTTTGDPVLLRTALTNLLQNAWKFTGQRPDAVIEFGQTENVSPSTRSRFSGLSPSATVFFVRDNGVGFDMRYADKLFTPFQRLHAMTDFPGTGIGLATVQRVLHRHGGHIWVEAAPGLGTTFYFTIDEDSARRDQSLEFEGNNVDDAAVTK